jgi:hypothetical protein
VKIQDFSLLPIITKSFSKVGAVKLKGEGKDARLASQRMGADDDTRIFIAPGDCYRICCECVCDLARRVKLNSRKYRTGYMSWEIKLITFLYAPME